MRPRFISNLLAAVLAIVLASSGFSQEQQTGKAQTPTDSNAPHANAPQGGNPQTPSGNDTQNAAPSQNQPAQATPKGDEPASLNQNPPTTQEQAPAQPQAQPPEQPPAKANTQSKPKTTIRKTKQNGKRKKETTTQPKSAHRPKAPAPSASGEPGKVVVRNGGATDDVIHLSPGGNQEQNAHNRENTEQLLATTDENLKRLSGRQLSPAEQGTVDQIHSYMRQAKSAADSGDLARAHTLAFKAHLLSDDLAKR